MHVRKDGQQHDAGNGRVDKQSGLALWFKLFAPVLASLVLLKLLGLQVVVEFSYESMPFMAAQTDARIYFVPLFLIFLSC